MRRRRRRVRLHLVDQPGNSLPSVEGVLVGFDHIMQEYQVAIPELHWAAGGNPDHLEARQLRVHRGRVAFYEVL